MENINEWLLPDLETSTIIIISVMLIFSCLIIITRIAGLRTFAKMTSFDLTTTIAIGSILASVAMDTTISIGNGLVTLAAIVIFQVIFAVLQRKSNLFRKAATNGPILIMKDGKILEEALKKSNLHRSELIAKLREANVLQFDDVRAVVFESTGDVSVLHVNDGDKKLQDEILDFKY